MNERERAAIEKAEKLTQELERSPAIVAYRAQEAEETLGRRKAAAAKIEDLKLDLEATGVIQREIDGMVERVAIMERERGALLEEIRQRRCLLARTKADIDATIQHEQKELLICYDPAIDESIEFFRERLDQLRRGKTEYRHLGTEKNLVAEVKIIKSENNAGAVESARRYCMDAIQELERMRLDPACDTARIEALKKKFPDIHIFTESVGEKPMPGSRGINPLHLLKSDSQLSWELDKISEKFKKIMQR